MEEGEKHSDDIENCSKRGKGNDWERDNIEALSGKAKAEVKSKKREGEENDGGKIEVL